MHLIRYTVHCNACGHFFYELDHDDAQDCPHCGEDAAECTDVDKAMFHVVCDPKTGSITVRPE